VKNGASKVEPAPVSCTASAAAASAGGAVLELLLHAAVAARTRIAPIAIVGAVRGRRERRGRESR
jgi:hypothetical protein